jgi:hypothetical protein
MGRVINPQGRQTADTIIMKIDFGIIVEDGDDGFNDFFIVKFSSTSTGDFCGFWVCIIHERNDCIDGAFEFFGPGIGERDGGFSADKGVFVFRHFKEEFSNFRIFAAFIGKTGDELLKGIRIFFCLNGRFGY